MSKRAPIFLVAAAAAALVAAPSSADAQRAKKPQPACGISYLPLVEGAQWTYEPFASPIPITEEDQAQLTKWAWVSPPAPTKITIKVTKVETTETGATITLDEAVDRASRFTTITCTPTSLEIDPQSFFFAVEPGGALLMNLSDVKREGGLAGAKGWKKHPFKTVTTVAAKLARDPTDGTGAEVTGGTVELERTLYVGAVESVQTPSGKHDKAQRLEFDLAGRVAVAPKLEKRIEIPLRWRGMMWFQDGVGLVQARNRIGHWFQLTEHNLK